MDSFPNGPCGRHDRPGIWFCLSILWAEQLNPQPSHFRQWAFRDSDLYMQHGKGGPVLSVRPESRMPWTPDDQECDHHLMNLAWSVAPLLASFARSGASHFLQNLPTPTLTCTVFSPGFSAASPALEICKYHNSKLQLYFSPRMCVPNAAPGVKFTVFA